jgi:transcriptional regulator with XRE-family HTH domain
MSPQLQVRPASPPDDPDDTKPWSILSFADNLVDRKASTTTRLGMPFVVPELNDVDVLVGPEGTTGSVASWGRQFWQSYVTSTESGVTYSAVSRSVREEVQRLRDEIARRTRLTRQQIARGLGVDRRSLSAWVKGEATPTIDKLRRLQLLAEVVRDIDATEPGRSTEILLSRTGGEDLLDHLAAGRIIIARDWQVFRGTTPSMTIEHRRSTKRPLHQNALDAYLRGELRPLGRAATVRPESDYEQDLSQAERVMFDEPVRRSRRGYRS